MTRARGMRWIALLAVWAVVAGAEPKASVVLSKLQAEKIGSVALQRVGPRQVVKLVHQRLVAHAKREGYRLVWEVADPLPERPRVSFGVENGSLALLLEAAAGFADLAVTDNDEELVVRSRSVARAVRETRRFPIRDEFWRSIRPRAPQKFFRQLGIKFPKGTEVRRSRDRRHLVVTHNPETLALVNEILQVTYAYPYSSQLELSIIGSDGRETPFAAPITLHAKSRSSIRHNLGEEDSYVDVSAKEEHWYRDSAGVRFALSTRVVRDGKLTFLQDTTLTLCHDAGTQLRLGGGEMLQVVAECQRPDGGKYFRGTSKHGDEWPRGSSENTHGLLAGKLPRVQADEEPVIPFLRRMAAMSREHDPAAVGLGIAYVLPSGFMAHETVRGNGWRAGPGVSFYMRDTPLGDTLDYVTSGSGVFQRTSANGVALYDPELVMLPLRKAVYGPSVFNAELVELLLRDVAVDRRTQGLHGGRLVGMELLFQEFGVQFPPGSRLDHAKCYDGWVVVGTNTRENFGDLDRLLWSSGGGLSDSMLWHTTARLVRLPGDAPEGDEIRRLLASGNARDRLAGAARLASSADRTVFSVSTTNFDEFPSKARFSGVGPGGGDVSLGVTASYRRSYNHAAVELEILGKGGKIGWRSVMYTGRDSWPRREDWRALRADALDLGRTSGDESYLLINHAANHVWMDVERCKESAEREARSAVEESAQEAEPTERVDERTHYWDLLFMFGLIEAGEESNWSPSFWIQSYAPQCRYLLDTDLGFLDRIKAPHRQCRLRLFAEDGGEVVECVSRFREDASMPVPGRPRKSIRLKATETVRGEEMSLCWRIGLGLPRTQRLVVGERVQLARGLWAQAEMVRGWTAGPVEPACATVVREEKERRTELLEWHRAAMDHYGGMEIAEFRLRNAPLPVALARIADRCRESLPDGAKGWRLQQPVFYGYLPEGAERVPWQGSDPAGEDPGLEGIVWDGGTGGGMGVGMGGDAAPLEQDGEPDRIVPEQRGGIADSELPELGEDGGSRHWRLDRPMEIHGVGGDDEDDMWSDDEDDDDDEDKKAPHKAVAYCLPVPKERATVDLRNVKLAELLAEVEKAYGVPLYLREKDGEILVRAAPLAHTARFGVRRKKLKTKTQAEFRAWLVKRGVGFQGDDRAVYFRALDTVVARGREDFVRQVGKALGKKWGGE